MFSLLFSIIVYFILHVIPILTITFFIIFKTTKNKVIKFTIIAFYCSIVNFISKIIKLFNIEKYNKMQEYIYNTMSPYENEQINEELTNPDLN